MEKSELLYEGKGKKMWSVKGNDELLIAEFKDDLTAFNAEKNGRGKCARCFSESETSLYASAHRKCSHFGF